MRVHLINLDRSPERLATMRQALAERGVGFERLAAIDGRTLAAEALARHPDISAGEIGCLLSHRAAWKLIADGDDPFGTVLEDDVLLSRSTGLFTATRRGFPRTPISSSWKRGTSESWPRAQQRATTPAGASCGSTRPISVPPATSFPGRRRRRSWLKTPPTFRSTYCSSVAQP
jgi:hypothetical protein